MRPRIVLAALALTVFLAPAAAPADDEPRPNIDLDGPCSFEGLPAVSADGRLVALVRCWSDLSDASEVTFQLVRARDGHVARTILLSGAATGGGNPTPEGLVRRAVRRANRVLQHGGFRSMAQVVDDDGNGERIERGAAAGLRLVYDPSAGRITVADASDGRPRAAVAVDNFPSHPYCCGYDEDEWQTVTCGLTLVLLGAWADAAAAVVVVEEAAWDGPDGCEEGPSFRVIPL